MTGGPLFPFRTAIALLLQPYPDIASADQFVSWSGYEMPAFSSLMIPDTDTIYYPADHAIRKKDTIHLNIALQPEMMSKDYELKFMQRY